MKTVLFWKMSGSGNDFVVIDNRKRIIKGNVAVLAERLCHRRFGVGADGLLLLDLSDQGAFRMVYYNADGSRAAMCGNGARCIAWVAHEKGVVGNSFDFLTDDGLIKGRIKKSGVEVTLSDARDFRPLSTVKAGGKNYRIHYLNTGVPHVVVRVPDVGRVDIRAVGPLLRHHKAFGPKGANVNFIERVNGHTLKVRTFERGVEDETLACGTGVAAGAIAAAIEGWVTTPVYTQTAGGDTLEVRFDAVIARSPRSIRSLATTSHTIVATHVRLKGPVRLTFKGEFLI